MITGFSHVSLIQLALLSNLILSAGLAAQTSNENPPANMHGEMEHSHMDHSRMGQTEQVAEHSQMDHAVEKADHSSLDHSSHHNTNLQDQGASELNNTRDPHAYSNGYTLTDGPYGMADSRHLKHGVEHMQWAILNERLEYNVHSDAYEMELQAWIGTTYDRFILKTDTEVSEGKLEENSAELLWSNAVAAYWDTQFGLRVDHTAYGTNRNWLAFGIQGLAPYWFEVDVTAYLGDAGRTALNAEAEYELLITQRLILQARTELTIYGKDDEENLIGKGLSSLSTGLRLRYEISRQFAPYIGLEWRNSYGSTADLAILQYKEKTERTWTAGLRFWL